MAQHGHALIAGAGIGGLTAALCLSRQGWQVDLYEASPAIDEVGAGLQLSPNAMAVFRALGLTDEIAARAFAPEALELRLGRSGRQIFSIPVNQPGKHRWRDPYLHIHRADLIGVLAAAAKATEGIQVHTAQKVAGYETENGQACLRLNDAATAQADLLIGADGLHSVIRRQMLGDTPARFTGNLAWRATVPMDRLDTPPPPTACVWAGPGRHAVTYRLRGGALANFVGIVESGTWKGENWRDAGSMDAALKDFEGWDPVITGLIRAADSHLLWGLYDRAPLPRWNDGAVTLLGDACHPMLPFQAQGAAQAIEDAFVLASEVSKSPDIPAALAHYEAIRKPRASRIQAASRANMKTFHKRGGPAQLATYGPMWAAGQLLPGFVRSRQDWIYSHDVTASDR